MKIGTRTGRAETIVMLERCSGKRETREERESRHMNGRPPFPRSLQLDFIP